MGSFLLIDSTDQIFSPIFIVLLSDTELFQHIARFYNCTMIYSYSYCCRLLELILKTGSCELHSQYLTYQHWAGVSPYTLPFGFAGTCVLDKQSLSNLLLWPRYYSWQGISHRLRPAFVPSSLNIFLPIALVFSTNPPVSVCGTVKYEFVILANNAMRIFLETESY